MPAVIRCIKGKRGLRQVFAYLILGLAIAIILLGIVWAFYQWASSADIEAKCRSSVRIAAIKIKGESLYDQLDCPTQYLTIKEKENEQIKFEIAGRMRSCYHMFWEGKYELFDEEPDNFCVICYVLDFQEKKEVKGMVDYLMTHKIPVTGKTYYEYLTPYQTNPELTAQTTDFDVINTNNKYAIMFNHVKPQYISGLEAGTLGAGIGFTAGALTLLIPGVNVVTLTGATIVGTSALGGGIGGFIFGLRHGEEEQYSGSIMLWPYTEEEALKLQCKYAPAVTK